MTLKPFAATLAALAGMSFAPVAALADTGSVANTGVALTAPVPDQPAGCDPNNDLGCELPEPPSGCPGCPPPPKPEPCGAAGPSPLNPYYCNWDLAPAPRGDVPAPSTPSPSDTRERACALLDGGCGLAAVEEAIDPYASAYRPTEAAAP